MYYVLGVTADRSWVLTPDERLTKARAQQAIRWQGRGGDYPKDYWRVCTWSAERKVFIDEQGNELTPDRGPYTEEAWAKYQEGFR